MLNLIVALTVVFGGVSAVFFIEIVETMSGLLIALSAGGFTYLAASELIPELHRERNLRKSVVQFLIFILGMALIRSLGVIFPE